MPFYLRLYLDRWNITNQNVVEWNINSTLLFAYFIQNVSFYCIHSKSDGTKNEELDEMDHIIFHFTSSMINKFKQ